MEMNESKVLEETREKNLEAVDGWVKLAHKFGVGVAVENMHDCIPRVEGRRAFGAIPSELLWLVENSDPEVVGICWDTCHAYTQKLNQYRAIKTLGKHLVHTHINDNLATSEEQHLTLFEGNVDWKEIVKGLREIELRYLLDLMEAMIGSL